MQSSTFWTKENSKRQFRKNEIYKTSNIELKSPKPGERGLDIGHRCPGDADSACVIVQQDGHYCPSSLLVTSSLSFLLSHISIFICFYQSIFPWSLSESPLFVTWLLPPTAVFRRVFLFFYDKNFSFFEFNFVCFVLPQGFPDFFFF